LWDTDPAYASDGRIAFVSNRSGAYEIWVSRPDGTVPIQLTRFQGPMVRSPRWSPDATRLAFEVRQQEHADLYVVDAAGGQAQPLTSDPADEVAPAWSPDGAWLYFGANRGGAWRLWKMPSAGGPAVPVTAGEGYAPQPSSDGAFVYYARSDEPGIWRVPAEGGEETLVVETLAPGDWGNWILSDEGIYFVRRTPVGVFLAFYDVVAHTTQDLRAFEQPPPRFQKGLSLSPDGQWLLHARLDQTQSDLMLVESFR
jgi:Tol biopolymer transport system component